MKESQKFIKMGSAIIVAMLLMLLSQDFGDLTRSSYVMIACHVGMILAVIGRFIYLKRKEKKEINIE